MQTCDETGSLRQCVQEWVCKKLDKYYIYMNVKFFLKGTNIKLFVWLRAKREDNGEVFIPKG